MNRILSSLTLTLAWMLMSMEVALMGSALGSTYYVDPDYAGGGNDGSAAHPWTSIRANWATINAGLATNQVTIYFSALKANGTTQQSQPIFLEVRRKDTSTNSLTLDGYAFYNSNSNTPSWQPNPNPNIASAYTNNQVFELTSDGWQALGWSRESGNDLVTHSGADYCCIKSHTSDSGNEPGTGANWQSYWATNSAGGPEWATATAYSCYVKQDNVTLRGFECNGTGSRVGFSGDNFLIEYVWVHDLTVGASMTLHYTTLPDNRNAMVIAAPSTNITIRNIRIENSSDEGIYLGAINPDSTNTLQCALGNQYDRVYITNFYISGAGTGGGQGDGIDCKNGITNIRISDGEISGGFGTMAGINCPLTFSDADQNMLVERVYIHGITNGTDSRMAINITASTNGVCFKGYNGVTVRDCSISSCRLGIVVTGGEGIIKNVRVYNNTIYNITDEGMGNVLQSNIMAWAPSPDPAVVGYCYYSRADNSATTARIDVGPQTQVYLVGLMEGLQYTFEVKAYNAEGVESPTLHEASYFVPVPIRVVRPLNATGPTHIQFPVAPGKWYELQASTNLKDWTTIWQTGVANAYTWTEFQDLQSAAYKSRYYRVQVH